MSSLNLIEVQNTEITSQTKQWIEEIVIGLNFCPFAKKTFDKGAICFVIENSAEKEQQLKSLIENLNYLQNHSEVETSFIVYNNGVEGFYDYLDLLDEANQVLVDYNFEGIFQIASFHPDYCFEGNVDEAVENYTNRSPYPMLHILREASLEKALERYKNPEEIPIKNIECAKSKGIGFFQAMLNKIKNN